MINSLKIKEVYNKRARVYDKLFERIRYNKTVKNILRDISIEIRKNARILDLGCGTGLATEALLIRFPKAEVIGFDYSEEMLNICKTKFPKMKAVIGDFNKEINLNKNSFELVVSTGAVSEYGNVKEVIPSIYSLLKKNGIFINIGIKKHFMNIVPGRLWHYRPIGKNEFIIACENSGFRKIGQIKLSWSDFPTNITKFVIKAEK